jgi:hypothetical protein
MLQRMSSPWPKLIVFLLLTMTFVGVYSVLTGSRLGKPDERRRIRHPDGFSIVVPNGWTGQVAGDRLLLQPERFAGLSPSVDIRRTLVPLSAKDPLDISFQSQPAQLIRHFSDKRHNYGIHFQRGPEWFLIAVRQRDREDHLQSDWKPFLESFRIDDVVRIPATTQAGE